MDSHPASHSPQVDQRANEMIALLRQKGFRLTPQRLAVLNLLAESDLHPTAEQIYTEVRRDFPTTSLATIYKTVNVLKEIGQLVELNCGDDCSRFDASRPGQHPHLVCVSCKSIVDVDLDGIADLAQRVAKATGYRDLSQQLQFTGLCPRCQREAAKPN